MTGQQALLLVRKFLRYNLSGYHGEEATEEEELRTFNWALRSVGKRLEIWHPNLTLTLTATETFNLRDTAFVTKRVVEPTMVWINGVPLRDHVDQYGLWGYGEFMREFPQWPDQTADVPHKAVKVGSGRIIIWPTPNATAIAYTNNYMSGVILPNDVTVANMGSELDEIPIDLHECPCYLAAVRLAMPQAVEVDMWTQIRAYNAEWVSEIEQERRSNMNARRSMAVASGGRMARSHLVMR